jgi:hypothetical protein
MTMAIVDRRTDLGCRRRVELMLPPLRSARRRVGELADRSVHPT